MQTANGTNATRFAYSNDVENRHTLIYGAVAAGVVLGAAASAYWWRGRARALKLLESTPFERVEELIASCESKIADIERTIEDLKKPNS